MTQTNQPPENPGLFNAPKLSYGKRWHNTLATAYLNAQCSPPYSEKTSRGRRNSTQDPQTPEPCKRRNIVVLLIASTAPNGLAKAASNLTVAKSPQIQKKSPRRNWDGRFYVALQHHQHCPLTELHRRCPMATSPSVRHDMPSGTNSILRWLCRYTLCSCSRVQG